MINRRHFLKTLALGALSACLPGRAHAFGESSQFIPAVARHGGDWDARLSALKSLCWEISSRTSIRAFPEPRPVALDSRELFNFPFLYMGGSREFPRLSEAEIASLRRFLTFGGFLLADAGDGSNGTGFDQSFRREVARLFPDRALTRLGADHVIFKSFYLIDRQAGRLATRPFLETLSGDSGRALIVYSQNDLCGAFQRDELGEWAFEVTGGASQREVALRLAVNLVMYASCLDYKADMLHLPFLMKRRR